MPPGVVVNEVLPPAEDLTGLLDRLDPKWKERLRPALVLVRRQMEKLHR